MIISPIRFSVTFAITKKYFPFIHIDLLAFLNIPSIFMLFGSAICPSKIIEQRKYNNSWRRNNFLDKKFHNDFYDFWIFITDFVKKKRACGCGAHFSFSHKTKRKRNIHYFPSLTKMALYQIYDCSFPIYLLLRFVI